MPAPPPLSPEALPSPAIPSQVSLLSSPLPTSPTPTSRRKTLDGRISPNEARPRAHDAQQTPRPSPQSAEGAPRGKTRMLPPRFAARRARVSMSAAFRAPVVSPPLAPSNEPSTTTRGSSGEEKEGGGEEVEEEEGVRSVATLPSSRSPAPASDDGSSSDEDPSDGVWMPGPSVSTTASSVAAANTRRTRRRAPYPPPQLLFLNMPNARRPIRTLLPPWRAMAGTDGHRRGREWFEEER